jgi:Fe-S-cluster-containing hydrogenase component 2
LLARLARHPTPSPSNVRFEIEPEDVIVGEMSCLSGMPRAADIMALEDGEVWEVRRNLLDRVMRSPAQRLRFRTLYRERALGLVLANAELFQHVPDDEYKRCVEFLKQVLTFVSVSPGQTIFQQGERADSMYLVRLGHIRVGVKQFGREVTVFYRGPGTVVGEIGLLPISSEEAHKAGDKIDRDLEDVLLRLSGPDELAAALPAGQRTATCSALDHVEMARIGRADFLEMIRRFPSVRRRLIHLSVERIGEIDAATGDIATAATRLEYINQGLYQGQSLLVLDLDRCTRCDLCTNACIEQHGTESHGVPITRLLREGLRFGSYLVATACRSCKDAYCMIGCPVDSIHRGKHLQIVIEDHCIGCGLCAQNCPYGNIFMIPNNSRQSETTGGPVQNRLVAAAKAATCDLCDADGRLQTPVPRCVYACPHDAAFRMTGEDLLKKVI